MSHNEYMYHFLKYSVPSKLLVKFGYPAKMNCRISQDATFIGFHGMSKDGLEAEFDKYIMIPKSYFPGDSTNLHLDDFKTITMTEGANDNEGFIPIQEEPN